MKRLLGGAGQFYSSAHSGDVISQQSTALASYLPLLKPAAYSKRIVIGEVGINDIHINNASAATVLASLQSLSTQIAAGGASSAYFLTIAPALILNSSQEAVRQSVNASLKAGAITGVTIIDNASDPRLQIPAGSTQGTTGPTNGYNDTDGLHWQDAGYGVYAENGFAAVSQLVLGTAAQNNVDSGGGVFAPAVND